MQYLKQLYELIFGKSPTGSERTSKVLEHFRALTRELSNGATEISAEMDDNQEQVQRLKDRIVDIKADNTHLGVDYKDATALQRGLVNLIEGANNESE